MSDRLRLFLAIWLDDEMHAALEAVDRWLEGLPSHRLTPRDQRHLTVAFLGDVSSSQASEVAVRVVEVCARLSPVRAEARGLIALPSPRTARVIALALDDSGGLSKVMEAVGQAAIHEAGGQAARRAQERPSRPHITLARARDGKAPERVDLSQAPEVAGTLGVEAVCIVKSTLTPRGPVYENLAVARLGGENGGNTVDTFGDQR